MKQIDACEEQLVSTPAANAAPPSHEGGLDSLAMAIYLHVRQAVKPPSWEGGAALAAGVETNHAFYSYQNVSCVCRVATGSKIVSRQCFGYNVSKEGGLHYGTIHKNNTRY